MITDREAVVSLPVFGLRAQTPVLIALGTHARAQMMKSAFGVD